jgi:hypothetical protein
MMKTSYSYSSYSLIMKSILFFIIISVVIMIGGGGEGEGVGVGVVAVAAVASAASSSSSSSRKTSSNNNNVDDPHLDSVLRIYEWINSVDNGYVNLDKQRPRRLIEGDINTPIIIIAIDDIEKDELLVITPWSHILKSDNDIDDDNKGWHCGTVRALVKEMELGEESFYAPYVTYLNDEPDNQLPTQYSVKAKQLLDLILGVENNVNENGVNDVNDEKLHLRKLQHEWDVWEYNINQKIMPNNIHDAMDEYWYGMCNGDRNDTLSAKAASFVIQRADDHILIPAYDSYNHRNGIKYLNAQTSTYYDISQNVNAIRNIKKGEQIFISYNMCKQCGGRSEYGFGTPEMYREYGFIEWYPQRW